MNILLSGMTGHGLNGTHQVQLVTEDKIDLNKKFVTVVAENEYFKDYPKSCWHGRRAYVINTNCIVCMWE